MLGNTVALLIKQSILVVLLCFLLHAGLVSTALPMMIDPDDSTIMDMIPSFHYYQHFIQIMNDYHQHRPHINDEAINNDINDHRVLQQQPDNNTTNTSTLPEWVIPTTPPTSLITDDEICNQVLSLTYRSLYEESKQPCTCQRSSDMSSSLIDNINVTTPGTFDVICHNYQYCTDCYSEERIDTTNTVPSCGTLYTNFTYYENMQYPKNPIPKDGYECITLQTKNTQVCLRTFLNTTNLLVTTNDYNDDSENTTASTTRQQLTTGQQQPEFSCQVFINELMCQSCEFVLCNLFPNQPFAQQLSFDCLNIEKGYIMNACDVFSIHDDDQYVTPPLNQTMLSDVLLYFDPLNNPYTFDSCWNESLAKPTPSFVTSTPVSAPTVSPPSSASSFVATTFALLSPNVPIHLLLLPLFLLI
jgi:hypothetical protein